MMVQITQCSIIREWHIGASCVGEGERTAVAVFFDLKRSLFGRKAEVTHFGIVSACLLRDGANTWANMMPLLVAIMDSTFGGCSVA
jgi:hypothetical protein